MARVSDIDTEMIRANDGKQTNMMITSSGVEGTLETGANRCRNKHESGVSDEDLTTQDPWYSLLAFLNIGLYSSFFRFIGLCCSSASSSLDMAPHPPLTPDSPASPPSSSLWYHSSRIQRMIENQRMLEERGQFRTKVESEIEASKVTWTQIDATISQTEHSRKANREYFDLLKRRKYVRKGDQIVVKHEEQPDGHLFRDYDGLVVGQKLAEGGQAEIYEAVDQDGEDMVVKVFKAGTLLQDLETQWPAALMQVDDPKRMMPASIDGATLLQDPRMLDRFAFVMERQWGDLRTLIDQQMMRSHNRGPPFTPMQVVWLMLQIAEDMNMLHGQHPPILHKDLKAANVLVESPDPAPQQQQQQQQQEGPVDDDGMYHVSVADYECSVGAEGTGLWRAPEILQQLKEEQYVSGSSGLMFSDKCDVYSFGMTCYELVTGRVPFEDCDFRQGCDLVLQGQRLQLPPDLDPCIHELILSCWALTPSHRPSFVHIIDVVTKKL